MSEKKPIDPMSVAAATPLGIAAKQAVHRLHEQEAQRAGDGQQTGFITVGKPKQQRAGSPLLTFVVVAAVLIGILATMMVFYR